MVWFKKDNSCKHYFEGVIVDDYQFCKHCGMAVHIPKKCEHVFKIIEQLKHTKHNEMKGERYVGNLYILRCEKCGEVEKRLLGIE